MMNSQWTAQDVERFREQQRWRLRHTTHAHRPHQPADNQMTSSGDDARARKVSLKFRHEHEQFAAKQLQGLALSPRARALAVTLRPAFSVAVPPTAATAGRARGRLAESPLPHTAYTMFNAFDSAASPEAFALARHDHNNQDERGPSEEDEEMASEHGEEDQQQQYGEEHEEEEEDATAGSLWRRRLHVQKHSPKLGRVALWDAAGGPGCGNQAAWVVERMPLPFADDDEL